MPVSQNHWPANDVTATDVHTIPGTTRTIRLRKGDAGYLLRHFAAWFHKHIEPIDRGTYDDWGYAERPVRGYSVLSNHASGTAIDLNATRHPLGRRGTFTPAQAAAIRKQLRVYDGAIRWGGDYTGRPDEMHFEINTSPAHVAAVARRIRSQEEDPLAAYTEKQLEKIIREAVRAELRNAGDLIRVDVGRKNKWSLSTALRTLVNRKKRQEQRS